MKKIFFGVFLMLNMLSSYCIVKSGQKKEHVKVKAEESTILNEDEKSFLLLLARDTLEEYLENKNMPEIDEKEISAAMKADYGCFVTLNSNGKLRGCIGYLRPVKPLYKAVMDNAVNAALNDPRFRAVTHEELKDIKLEISVLSELKRLDFDSPDELLNKLVPMRDGVVLKIGVSSSTFLPQVWESLSNKKDFLSQLSLKSGNMPDAWKGKDVEVYTYFAEVFHEE